GRRLGVNYGLDRVRFPAPVRAGANIRARVRLLEVQEIAGGLQLKWNITVECEGATKPSCVAGWLGGHYDRGVPPVIHIHLVRSRNGPGRGHSITCVPPRHTPCYTEPCEILCLGRGKEREAESVARHRVRGNRVPHGPRRSVGHPGAPAPGTIRRP